MTEKILLRCLPAPLFLGCCFWSGSTISENICIKKKKLTARQLEDEKIIWESHVHEFLEEKKGGKQQNKNSIGRKDGKLKKL